MINNILRIFLAMQKYYFDYVGSIVKKYVRMYRNKKQI